VGEEMILENNFFVEAILPGATVRKLTEEEMSVYRAPFQPPSRDGPPGDSRMRFRSRENPPMCTQAWKKHMKL